MTSTAEALVGGHRPVRPHLRVVVDAGSARPAARQRIAGRRRIASLLALAAVVTVLALVTGTAPLVAGSGLGRGAATRGADDGAVRAPAVTTVVVAPGDTVWGLAREHLPEGVAPSDFVAEILAVNDLDPAALQPGTVVRLPTP